MSSMSINLWNEVQSSTHIFDIDRDSRDVDTFYSHVLGKRPWRRRFKHRLSLDRRVQNTASGREVSPQAGVNAHSPAATCRDHRSRRGSLAGASSSYDRRDCNGSNRIGCMCRIRHPRSAGFGHTPPDPRAQARPSPQPPRVEARRSYVPRSSSRICSMTAARLRHRSCGSCSAMSFSTASTSFQSA